MLILLSACETDPDPLQYRTPHILQTNSTVEKNSVILSCSVSERKNITGCGFFFGTDETELKLNECSLDSIGVFSLKLDNLTFDTDYYFSSFIKNGHDVQSSETQHLRIQQQLPDIELKPITSRGSSYAIIEYEVNYNFSGDLVACGICYASTPGPTINEATKTIDSDQYGAHRTQINDLGIGNTFYVRAYAINNMGTTYSNELSFYVPVTFDDHELNKQMLKIGDSDKDNFLSIEEAKAIKEVSICTDEISNLSGLEYCTSITSLNLYGSVPNLGQLREMDLSPFPELEHLRITANKLTSIDLSTNTKLKTIAVNNNFLSSFEMPPSPNVTALDISSNNIKTLDISGYEALTSINASINILETLLLPMDSHLEELNIKSTGLYDFNNLFPQIPTLKRLNIQGILRDNDHVYLLTELEELDCSTSMISTLDVSRNPMLKILDCSNTLYLKQISVSRQQDIAITKDEDVEIVYVD